MSPPPSSPLAGAPVPCDFCSNWAAVVHCRADDARLCLACDHHVHSANAVSSKHPRSPLCDACAAASAAIFCSTHALLLCHACDFETHKPDGAAAHDRRPVEPFSGCPSAVELLEVFGVGGDKKGVMEEEEDFGSMVVRESWIWETAPVLCLDDLIVPTSADHGYHAVGVPPLPKTRNDSCGKQKNEIIQQIDNMLQYEGSVTNQENIIVENIGFQDPVKEEQFLIGSTDFSFSDATADLFAEYKSDFGEAISSVPDFYLSEKYAEENQQNIDGQNGINGDINQEDTREAEEGHHIAREDLELPLTTKIVCELSGPERDSAISRYREKRKARRYDKQVRYESRKARAEGRVRIRGRFAKMDNNSKA